MIMPYDMDNPPEEPPEGADRLVWLLAWGVHVEHQSGANGFCTAPTCAKRSALWPCRQSKLATGGFVFAAWHLRKWEQGAAGSASARRTPPPGRP